MRFPIVRHHRLLVGHVFDTANPVEIAFHSEGTGPRSSERSQYDNKPSWFVNGLEKEVSTLMKGPNISWRKLCGPPDEAGHWQLDTDSGEWYRDFTSLRRRDFPSLASKVELQLAKIWILLTGQNTRQIQNDDPSINNLYDDGSMNLDDARRYRVSFDQFLRIWEREWSEDDDPRNEDEDADCSSDYYCFVSKNKIYKPVAQSIHLRWIWPPYQETTFEACVQTVNPGIRSPQSQNLSQITDTKSNPSTISDNARVSTKASQEHSLSTVSVPEVQLFEALSTTLTPISEKRKASISDDLAQEDQRRLITVAGAGAGRESQRNLNINLQGGMGNSDNERVNVVVNIHYH